MWPSVVVHEHWPVSQRMIVEMGDYAWSEHIVTVFLTCPITIKNVQVQLTVKGKTTPDSYRTRIVQHFLQQEAVQTISWPAMSPDMNPIDLQQEAVQTIPWPAMSPDMNPIDHVWDFIARKINQRNPKCQNIDELRTAILQDCIKMQSLQILRTFKCI
jgi:hypothetical protein